MKTGKPLIERYFTYLRISEESAFDRLKASRRITLDQYNFNLLLMQAYGSTYRNMAEFAQKYQLAASAQAMIDALRPQPLLLEETSMAILDAITSHKRPLDPDIETPIIRLPGRPLWLELEQPIYTNTGEIAAIFFACPDHEIEHQMSKPQTQSMREVLKASRGTHGYKWSLHFIHSDGTPVSLYEYHEDSRAWSIIPNVEPCPTEECKEVDHGDGSFHIDPCPFCATILAYWRSWFVTALLTIQGEFAATEAIEWPVRTEQTTRKVKRPNSGKYDEIQVQHDYHIISFDASVKRQHTTSQDQDRESLPRGSWLAAAQAIDKESVVYVRHDFGQRQRQLDPARNPRWKEKKIVEVKAHARRIPMKVDNLQRRITRVIASHYEDRPEPGQAERE